MQATGQLVVVEMQEKASSRKVTECPHVLMRPHRMYKDTEKKHRLSPYPRLLFLSFSNVTYLNNFPQPSCLIQLRRGRLVDMSTTRARLPAQTPSFSFGCILEGAGERPPAGARRRMPGDEQTTAGPLLTAISGAMMIVSRRFF